MSTYASASRLTIKNPHRSKFAHDLAVFNFGLNFLAARGEPSHQPRNRTDNIELDRQTRCRLGMPKRSVAIR